MGCDELWEKIKNTIGELPEADAKPEWREFYTKLQPQRNLIFVEEDILTRISTGKPQSISKQEIYDGFARIAMDANDRQFSIADPDIRPARMGSFVCSLLSELHEFDYLPGRILRYNGKSS